jgi:DNA-binding GntR family transcriptional regulator
MTLALEELAERHLRSRDALPDAIAKALREGVFSGVFAPNERLHQDEIAKRFGVSRVPVREALMKLVAEGLAIQRMNKGVRVAPLTREDFHDIMEMRLLLEPHALALSAPRLTDRDLEEAELILAQVRTAGVGSEAAALHWRFHMRLYARAERPRLLGHIEALHLAINRYVLPIWRTVGLSSTWDNSHQAIIDALRANDIKSAAGLTRMQIREALDRMTQQLPATIGTADNNEQDA